MEIRNCVFDVDGTLLDSKRDIAAAQLWTLQQFGFHDFTAGDIYPQIGKPLKEIFATLLPVEYHARIPEAAVMYVEYYRSHALETTKLFPRVHDTLERLYRRGVRLAIATTKSTETTVRLSGHFDIKKYFTQIQGTDNMPYKPDPFILNKIIADQEWDKDETVMMGDTAMDVLTGKNAGVRTCVVTYGAFPKEQIQSLQADWTVDSFDEILEKIPFFERIDPGGGI
jgi:HAD superfamily hydrolase (TIGR01509 family)